MLAVKFNLIEFLKEVLSELVCATDENELKQKKAATTQGRKA